MTDKAEMPDAEPSPIAQTDVQGQASLEGIGNLVESVTPWLIEIGGWIFGGLSAVGLVTIASLITVGPVDRAILIGAAVLAAALPLNVAGILLLRLIKDTKDLRLDDLALDAFQRAGFPNIEAYFPPIEERASLERRRAQITLIYCWAILALSTGLTVVGLLAALWHIAWWTAAALVLGIVVGAILVASAMAQSLPVPSPAEREMRRRASRPT